MQGLNPVGYFGVFRGDEAMIMYLAFSKLRDIAHLQTKSRHFRLGFFFLIYHRRVFTYCTWVIRRTTWHCRPHTTGVKAQIPCGYVHKYDKNNELWSLFIIISNKLHNLQGFVIRPGHENLVSMSAVDTIADEGIRYLLNLA